MNCNKNFVNARLVMLLLSIVGLIVTSMPSMACSLAPPPAPIMKADGTMELPFDDNDYAILGEVVGQKNIPNFGKNKLPVTAISVRVIRSDTPKAKAGQELSFHLFTIIDPSCGMRGVSLTIKDYPVGARLRIISASDIIAEWEAGKRITKIPAGTTKTEARDEKAR